MTVWRGYTLQPHQTRAAECMLGEDGVRALLLFYRVGSGKTLTALYAIEQLYHYWKRLDSRLSDFPRVLIIAPAKVITEVWEPAIRQLKLPADRFRLYSFDMARIHHQEYEYMLREIRRSHIEHPEGEYKHPYKSVLIVDESHTVRTTSSLTFHAIFSIAAEAYKVLLLTGTPMVNSVEDLQAQLRLLTDDLHATVPSAYFVKKETLEVIHERDFNKLFSGRVLSHLIPINDKDYPDTDRTLHQVPMYDLQRQRYEDFDKEMMTPALRSLMKEGVISTALNSFLTRTRAISNTVGRYALPGEKDTPELSAKFRGIRQSLVNDPKPAVVYSFYLDNGVIPLKEFVDSTTTLRTALITGITKSSDLKCVMKAYNEDRKIDVLFLTSAVRQGISLLRTRTVHIMESGWNESLQEQVIGRVVRYGSHSDLPLNQRHVQIHFWLTTIGRQPSTDQYIYSVAQRKMELISKFEDLLTRLPPPKNCREPVIIQRTRRAFIPEPLRVRRTSSLIFRRRVPLVRRSRSTRT